MVRRLMRASWLLLLLLPTPGCATRWLWQDHRTHGYESVAHARAYHLYDDVESFVVALDERAVARLRQGAPECAAAPWCEVRLPSVAAATAFFEREDRELWLLHEAGEPATWYVGERERHGTFPPPLPPTRVACTVTPLQQAPASLAAEIEGLQVVDVAVQDDQTPTAVRIVATPFAVVADGAYAAYLVAATPVALALSPILLLFRGL
jgi:hypothetical protein